MATLLFLLAFICLPFAADLQIESIRQKRQTSGLNCVALTVLNGMVNYLQTNQMSPYAQGSTAILQCNLGYTPVGQTNSICTNGMWSPAIGTCIQSLGGTTGFSTSLGLQNGATCLALIAPLNGRLQYSAGGTTGPFSSGTSVQVYCNSGYTVSGSQTSTCQSGIWSPAILGSCISSGFGTATTSFGVGTAGVQCSAAITPLNGQIQYNGIPSNGFYSSGSSATLVCNSGTYVSGSSTSFCANGLWTPAFGMCISSSTGLTSGSSIGFGSSTQCLFPIAAPLGGTVQYSTGSTTAPFSEGASATLICSGGTATGTTVAVCQSGQWQPSFFTGCSTTGAFGSSGLGTTNFGTNGFGTTLTTGQCLAPITSVLGGTITYSQGGQYGPYPQNTYATLQCLNGQQSSGVITSSCMNGFWSPATLGPCGSNAGFMGTTSTGIGTGISNGLNNLANGLSSTFGNLQSSCLMGLIPPLNGRITYSNGATMGPFPTGTTATLTCNSGFPASQTTSATCMNGMFSPSSLSTCNTAGHSPSMSMNNFGSSSNNTSAVSACYEMPPVQNGQITYSPSGKTPYPLGSLATLMCQGAVGGMASCTATGWSPSLLISCGSSSSNQAFESG